MGDSPHYPLMTSVEHVQGGRGCTAKVTPDDIFIPISLSVRPHCCRLLIRLRLEFGVFRQAYCNHFVTAGSAFRSHYGVIKCRIRFDP